MLAHHRTSRMHARFAVLLTGVALACLLPLGPSAQARPQARVIRHCADASKPDRALAACEAIIQAERVDVGDLTRAHLNRGRLLAARGSYGAAIEDFARVIALDPANAQALYERGLSQRAINEDTAAMDSFARAIGVRPGHVPARLIRRDPFLVLHVVAAGVQLQ